MDQPRVILRTPWGGPWRVFTRPDAIFVARHADDVRGCLADVDAAVRETGGVAAGFVTYEAAAAFGLPVTSPDPDGPPLAWFGLFPQHRIEQHTSIDHGGAYRVGEWRPSVSREAYRQSVGRIREQIEAGDTYQINYTWRLRAGFEGDPLTLFLDLDEAQRGAWSAFVDIGRHVICSASPELFFAVDGGRIECRPMKGTSSRGLSAEGDRERAEALRDSAKNRAENVMVVDMTRNDLGRIAQVGSVRVPSIFDVERYPAQWQMVSTVEADAGAATLPEIFEALFPSGSVTGAPKHSSMSIIREIEDSPRSVYTGAIGCVSRDRAHFNVAIRTVEIDRDRDEATFGVGSGIVWDSVERDEYDECLIKASILTARLPPFDLLESIAWTREAGFLLLDAHIERMRSSAEYFHFAPVPEAQLRSALLDCISSVGDVPQKVRLLVTRKGEVRCETSALIPRPDPLRVAIASEAVHAGDVFLYHKTTNRRVYEQAQRDQHGADAVILWNWNGEVTEAVDANIVVETGGEKVTPPVACGLLPGVKRAELLASGEISERRITLDDVRRAGALWLINSVRGWMRGVLVER